ncbi:YdeI/OmpD-associated family protein [Polaromonas sp. SM01]
MLFRLQTAKKPETHVRRITEFAQMLARGEMVYPQRR